MLIQQHVREMTMPKTLSAPVPIKARKLSAAPLSSPGSEFSALAQSVPNRLQVNVPRVARTKYQRLHILYPFFMTFG